MGVRKKSVPPQHHSARHHDITHETFTSLFGQGDHASLPLVEAGSAQNRRWGSIGVVGVSMKAERRGGWWGYWIDRSAPTQEDKGRRLLLCKWQQRGWKKVLSWSDAWTHKIVQWMRSMNMKKNYFCPSNATGAGRFDFICTYCEISAITPTQWKWMNIFKTYVTLSHSATTSCLQ